MNLYELSKEFSDVEQRLDCLDDEQDEQSTLFNLLAALECDGNTCAGHLLEWVKNLEASIEARKNEILRLRVRTASEEKRIENIRAYIFNWLKQSGQTTLKTSIATASIRKGSKRLEVDVEQVPNWPASAYDAAVEAGVVKETITVNKTELKKTFVNYADLPGVSEIVGDDTLTIR
jgi:hypothetical protein